MEDKNNITEQTEKKNIRRRIITGVLHFLKKTEERIVDKKQIEQILPHKGRMLLLDRVIITEEKIIGEFKVTEEVCEGHPVLEEGKTALKGSDLLDMSAQLLGIWVAQGFGHKLGKKVVREYGGAKFRKPICPGENLILEIATNRVLADDVRGDGKLIIVKGDGFLARVGEEETGRAKVYSVELVLF